MKDIILSLLEANDVKNIKISGDEIHCCCPFHKENKPSFSINLENGKYKLCETIAPKGYTLKTECINFTVDSKKIISVTMENDTTITPPNTGMFSSKSIYIIGGLLIVIGFSTIVIIYNK